MPDNLIKYTEGLPLEKQFRVKTVEEVSKSMSSEQLREMLIQTTALLMLKEEILEEHLRRKLGVELWH